jgi:hypothetical protein
MNYTFWAPSNALQVLNAKLGLDHIRFASTKNQELEAEEGGSEELERTLQLRKSATSRA